MKYDLGIVIGRFQPFHLAHLELLNHCLENARHALVILGSARNSPDVRNPFTPEVRKEMISSAAGRDDLIFREVRDYPYNENFWTSEIQNAVQETCTSLNLDPANVALFGHYKDQTSYYLNRFPQWKFEEFFSNEHRGLSGTSIRELYFSGSDFSADELPNEVIEYLTEFRKSDTFEALRREFEYLEKYKTDTSFKGADFPPTFVTTDCVVTCSGHLLAIRRGFQPGLGKLALPGGFLRQNLTLRDSAIRELKDETRIKIPIPVLRGSIVSSEVFDDPGRSLRGRTVTHAFHIDLEAKKREGLPNIKGGDDAKAALWLPVSSLATREDEFFEDHLDIVRHFLGLIY